MTIKPSQLRQLSKSIKGKKDTEERGYFAVIGKKDGTVSTGVPGIIWVTVIATGQEIQVINRRYVPNRRGVVVFIGSDKQSANKIEVLYMLNTDGGTNGGVPTVISTVPPHNHSWPGENTTYVYSEQIMWLLAKPIAGTLTIQIYPGVVRNSTDDGWVYIPKQIVDVSGDMPGSGALWVTLQANDDATVDYVVGVSASDRISLDENDIPEPTTGRAIWAVILEAGYNELFQNLVRNDFLDLRFGFLVPATAPIGSSRYFAAYNYYLGSGTPGYKIGLATSEDGRTWTVQTEPVLDLGSGGSWDDDTLQFPRLLQVDGVLWLFYSGKDGAGWSNFKIGVARSYDGGQTWTKYASNPVLSNAVAWENTNVFSPVVLYDKEESNASKRWKMWFAGSSFGEGIGYAYSADGLSWTKSGSNPVLSLGAGGQWDDTYIMPDAIIRRGSEFILFYSGNNGSGTWSAGYATFTDPEGTYTKSSYNPILTGDGITTTLTSNLTSGSTTASVTDATVFPIGCPVWIGNDANHFLTHIVAQNSSTSLELADAAPATISSGLNVRSAAYNSLNIRGVFYDDGYNFIFSPHQIGFTGLTEVTMRAYANDDLQAAYIDYGAGIQIPITVTESQNTNTTRENWSMVDIQETEERHKPAKIDATYAPWLVDIIPTISDPSATTGTWGFTNITGENVTYPFVNTTPATGGGTILYNSSAAQNDAISWDVVLSAGTWDISIHCRKASNTGIFTVNLDGSPVGTADSYSASAAYGKLQVTGFTVASDGKHTIQLKMATKNGSSSGYLGELFGISLRRTA